MMAQAAGKLGAVIRRSRWTEVVGNRRESGGSDGNPVREHRQAIETSPAKRVSCVPSMFDSLGVQVPYTT